MNNLFTLQLTSTQEFLIKESLRVTSTGSIKATRLAVGSVHTTGIPIVQN